MQKSRKYLAKSREREEVKVRKTDKAAELARGELSSNRDFRSRERP